MADVIALAASAFLAATLLPASSEAVLAGLVVAEAAPAALLLAVASVFNTAGSCVNWLMGRAEVVHFLGPAGTGKAIWPRRSASPRSKPVRASIAARWPS